MSTNRSISCAILIIVVATIEVKLVEASDANSDENPHPLAAHLAFKLRGSGEWRTPNPDHEPADPNSPALFGVNLEWAPERQHVRGEVVGLTDDGRSARYQTFYVVFNPETEMVLVQQIGWDGAYAYGEQGLRTTELVADEVDVLDMRIVSANRPPHVLRHRDTVLDPDRYRSEVLVQNEDGGWESQRQWTWQRVKQVEKSDSEDEDSGRYE